MMPQKQAQHIGVTIKNQVMIAGIYVRLVIEDSRNKHMTKRF
jgi:hypothetical protein